MSSYAKYNTIGVEQNSNTPTNSSVYEIKNLQERRNFIKNNPIVVIDYFTEWCGPCKSIAPQYMELALKYKNMGVVLLKENADKKIGDYPKPIKSVPVFHFYSLGHVRNELTVNGGTIEQIENNIQLLINELTNSNISTTNMQQHPSSHIRNYHNKNI